MPLASKRKISARVRYAPCPRAYARQRKNERYNVRWLSTVLLLALAVPFGQAQGATRKCTPTYQNHNAIDYGPLVFRNLSGWAIAPAAAAERISGACLGLFTEEEHRLVAVFETGPDGSFAFAALAPRRYRLVAQCEGLCVANVPLKIVRWPQGGWHRRLVLHMNVQGIDACSHGAYK